MKRSLFVILPILAVGIMLSFQNCSSGKSLHAGSAGDASLQSASTSPCSLSISGPTDIAFNDRIRFLSNYTGDSTGLTAFWGGTNNNVETGNVAAVITAQPTVIHLLGNGAVLADTDYKNGSVNYVGSYTRYLEYRRGNDVVCRTNTLSARFLP